MNTEPTPSAAPALDRGLNIIEFILESGQPVTLKKISESLSIPIASAFRLMKSLVNRGYVEEIAAEQQLYVPGNRLFQIVRRYQMNHPLQSMAQPSLKELAMTTGQTAQLALYQNNTVIYIDQVIPSNPVSIVAPMHTPIPINVCAAGKIICAQFSKEEQRLLLSSENLSQRTPNSICDVPKLMDYLDQARGLGYATDMEEYARGIGCVSAPIFDGYNRCIGAIGVTGHIEQYHEPAIFEENMRLVVLAARKVSRSMGYRGDSPSP